MDKTKMPNRSGANSPGFGWFARGLAMGVADMVPGISGGTMALVTGIYPRFIAALAACNGSNLIRLVSGQGRLAWAAVDGNFLLTLLAGILTAIVLMSHIVGWLFAEVPVMVWGFFLGLLLLALGFMVRDVRWTGPAFGVAVVCASVALATVFGGSVAITPTLPWLFVGGMVAITAMILPGISGSLILLMLGLYSPAVEAVRTFDLAALGVLAAGCATGILVFSRLLHWTLRRYENLALAGMTGVVAGAMLRLWPWQAMTETATSLQLAWPNSAGELGLGVLAIFVGMMVFAFLSPARPASATTD
ncbi:MAG: DUF368 domain-containing protein [Natronospirillum sp.]